MTGRQVKAVAGWSSFMLFIVTQFEVRPWPLFAVAFFLTYTAWWVLDSYYAWKYWHAGVAIGGTLNIIALAGNQWRMPVLGKTDVSRWWQPLTEHSRFRPLCDIHWGFSVGDFIILSTALVAIAIYCYQKAAVNTVGQFNFGEQQKQSRA